MKHFSKFFALSGILFIFGCKDSSTQTALSGTMVGYVNFIDSAYESWVNFRSIGQGHLDDVRVSLDGTHFQTITDSVGKWTLTNVPAGTYAITYTKAGYASIKEISHTFVGNGTEYIGEVIMDQIPMLL